MLKERRRVLKRYHAAYQTRNQIYVPWNPDPISSDTGWSATQGRTLYSHQVTLSEGHGWPKGRSVRDVGGPFSTVKTDFEVSRFNRDFDVRVDHGLSRDFFRGKVLIFHPDHDLSLWQQPELSLSDAYFYASGGTMGSDVLARGTKMIASSLPTNPAVDGSVALAELFREGIPSMIGSSLLRDRSDFFRNLGSEYLNFEFGWKPLVNDLKDAAKAVVESEKILVQLVRDSGKNVRRRRHFPRERQVEVKYSTLGVPRGTESIYWWNPSRARLTDTKYRDTWFSGCYTFHYDPGHLSEISRIATEARLLYGLELNPEVVWNLAPWSWLVDWFANVGPLLNNVSAFQNDQLALRYGYVMDRHQRVLTQVVDVDPANAGNSLPTSYSERFTIDWKRREQATPYGFGVAHSSFTQRQWAILAALGITRAG